MHLYSVSNAGCSVRYKLDAYPQFKGINSQTVEQSNSTLKRIKPSLSYMNAGNFMNHIQAALEIAEKKTQDLQRGYMYLLPTLSPGCQTLIMHASDKSWASDLDFYIFNEVSCVEWSSTIYSTQIKISVHFIQMHKMTPIVCYVHYKLSTGAGISTMWSARAACHQLPDGANVTWVR